VNDIATILAEAALRLHRHLDRTHLQKGLLAGPDPGVRLNLRFWRFLKSYAGLTNGPERHVFMQGAAYWIMANWVLLDLRGEQAFGYLAARGADRVADLQRGDGSWQYPLKERRHLAATIEGNWASLALLESFRRTGEERYLRAALDWKRFLLRRIGFQSYEGTLAVNYFDRPRGNIPNNTTNTLWFLAESALHEPDAEAEEKIHGMKAFLKKVQRPNGEFPYIVESPYEKGKPHYLCFQYNAFEFLDLCHYYRIRGDEEVVPMLESLAGFLSSGLTLRGWARTSCIRERPRVIYYTASLAYALWKAHALGISGDAEKWRRGILRVLEHQNPRGSFPHSRGDYGILEDSRSYPRYQAMILYFLASLSHESGKDR
jgi:hypothetical protein